MALNINRLADNINAILDDYDGIAPGEKAAKRADFSNKLATAIINEIKQATVTVPGTGLTAGATAVTGISNTGTLS